MFLSVLCLKDKKRSGLVLEFLGQETSLYSRELVNAQIPEPAARLGSGASAMSSSPSTDHGGLEFKLFETQSVIIIEFSYNCFQNFYMTGWDGIGVYRVLKIDRLDPSELNISEDSTPYTEKECYELLKRIHKLVTLCYGFIGLLCFFYTCIYSSVNF